MYPSNYLYSKDHEWVLVDEINATIGITEFARNQLGDVVFVELPKIADRFNQNDEIGTIESVKAVAEIYAIVSGEVAAINEALREDPELLNDDPHGNGWLVRLTFTDTAQLRNLMNADQYQEYLKSAEE